MEDRKLSETKLAWLAGLIDGEGCIAVYKLKEDRPKDKGQFKYGFRLRPALYISNGDTVIIAEVEAILRELLANCKTTYRVDILKKSPRCHINYLVRVQAKSSLLSILGAVEPYLIGKKAQAQVLLNMLRNSRPQHGHWCQYTKAELEVVEILKEMKTRNQVPVSGNAELSRDDKSQACVENIQATLPIK